MNVCSFHLSNFPIREGERSQMERKRQSRKMDYPEGGDSVGLDIT